MAGNRARKTGKKNRKWNRNKLFCVRYSNENRRDKNKLRRINHHLKKNIRMIVLRLRLPVVWAEKENAGPALPDPAVSADRGKFEDLQKGF